MKFELKLALRFLKAGKGQTLFIMLGIAIGVAVQIFLGTLITGLQEDLVNATVGKSPHIVLRSESTKITQREQDDDSLLSTEGNFIKDERSLSNWEPFLTYLDSQEQLTAVSPVVSGNAFLIKSGLRSPLVIRGIDSDRADDIYRFEEVTTSGSYQLSGNQSLIGSEIARTYALDIGDSFLIELAGGTSEIFIVSGIFDLGTQGINETWVFLDLIRAQRLLDFGGNISSIELQVSEVFKADQIANQLDRELIGADFTNWKDENASLLSALNSQSSSSYTIQFFVLMAITLGIASVLAVSVVQKQRQIGILKAMGTSSKSARNIFILQGAILGFLGAMLGVFLGFLLIQGFLFGTAAATGDPLFALNIRFNQTMVILLITTLASIISAVIPARNSAKLNPIDVMKG